MKSLKPRLLTAVIGIPLLLGILFLSEMWNPLISIVVGIASAFMVGEYLSAKGLLKHYLLSIPCMLFSFASSIIISSEFIFLSLVLFMIIAFSVMIASHKKITYIELVYALLGTLLISFGMSSLSLICTYSVSITFFFVTAFALPWMADAGGFFVGATLGKHKLCPKISPKKSVEGAIGGIAGAVLLNVLLLFLFKKFIFESEPRLSYIGVALLSIVLSIVSMFGDLAASTVKRNFGIKDFGKLLPGHGGIMDRFDSALFVLPVLYSSVYIVNMF